MEEVHKLHGTDFELHDDFVDSADEDIVEEVGDDADDEAGDGSDHSLVDAGGEELDVDIVAGVCHILEGFDHTGDGAEETEHRSERGDGGDERDAFFEFSDFEFAFVFDGGLGKLFCPFVIRGLPLFLG